MSYQPGIPANVHNPKLLHPLFQAKKAWIAPAALVAVALVVCLLLVLPPWMNSLSYGDISLVETSAQFIDPERAESDPDIFPRTYDVERAFEELENHFQVNFRHCTLLELVYNQEYSDDLRQKLNAAYGDPHAFVVTGSFTTGSEKVPQGLEPNTTYDNYQWILDVSWKILDHGQDLFSQ